MTPDFLVELPIIGPSQVGDERIRDYSSPVYIEVTYTLENDQMRKKAERRAQTLELSTDDPVVFVGLQEIHASLAGWIVKGDGTSELGAITRRRSLRNRKKLAGPCLYVGPMAEIWFDGFAAAAMDELVLPTYRDFG